MESLGRSTRPAIGWSSAAGPATTAHDTKDCTTGTRGLALELRFWRKAYLERQRSPTWSAAPLRRSEFHAGTATANGQIVNDGGRVLGVTALGRSLAGAKLQAYTAVKAIRWQGAWCRKDISDKALALGP